jgi:trehalose-6-phosphate synthase
MRFGRNRVRGTAELLQAYCRVNKEFANCTLEALRKSVRELDEEERYETCPVVWIHDYQLLVAATTIRQVRATCPAHFIFLDFTLFGKAQKM